jgi:hypothetical protein
VCQLHAEKGDCVAVVRLLHPLLPAVLHRSPLRSSPSKAAALSSASHPGVCGT